MKTGSRVLTGIVGIAISALLAAAQGPPPGAPPESGPPPDRPAWRQEHGPRHRMGPGPGHGRRSGHRRPRLGRLLRDPGLRERLGMTAEQAARIQARESEFAKSNIRAAAELRVKRMELAELLAAEKPDRAQVDKKMREIHEAAFAAKRAAMDHHLAMREALTPEQKERLKQWAGEQRERRMREGFGPRPGPGPGPEGPPRPPEPPARPPA